MTEEEWDEFARLWRVIHEQTKDIRHYYIPLKVEVKMTRCECGAEKCNTPHSDWCPKYEESE